VTPALRHERTKREAQHLLAFSFLHTGQVETAANAFLKSVHTGNETDWQSLIELLVEHPNLRLT
jgi:Tfp pilus assembly protein PilF